MDTEDQNVRLLYIYKFKQFFFLTWPVIYNITKTKLSDSAFLQC